MAITLNPYISFNGTARAAMEFYQSVFGGKLDMQTFGEAMPTEDPADNDLIMHGQLSADHDLVLMGSDTPARMAYTPGSAISISISGDDDATLTGYFEKLSDGGTVSMPLETAPWGDKFGMCTDKFGIDWLVNVAGTKS